MRFSSKRRRAVSSLSSDRLTWSSLSLSASFESRAAASWMKSSCNHAAMPARAKGAEAKKTVHQGCIGRGGGGGVGGGRREVSRHFAMMPPAGAGYHSPIRNTTEMRGVLKLKVHAGVS